MVETSAEIDNVIDLLVDTKVRVTIYLYPPTCAINQFLYLSGPSFHGFLGKSMCV